MPLASNMARRDGLTLLGWMNAALGVSGGVRLPSTSASGAAGTRVTMSMAIYMARESGAVLMGSGECCPVGLWWRLAAFNVSIWCCRYTGDFVDGKSHGKGEWTHPDGVR